MARKRTPDGKRVVMAAKVSEQTADAVDGARGDQTRSAWLQDAIGMKLSTTAKPAVRNPASAQESRRTAGWLPARARPAASECPHPKARVHKGLCGACGTAVH